MKKVLFNGRIYLDRHRSCEALLIEGGRILKTGSSRDLLDEVSTQDEKIDAQGSLVLPAFYDSHVHLMWIGRRAQGIECAGAQSIQEVIDRGRDIIKRHKAAPGTHIQGAGVNPDRFTRGEKRDLNRDDLDQISREHLIVISRHCGHIIYCNSAALEKAGISESAPMEIKGGTIEKDEAGRPTGVLRENANALVRGAMPPFGEHEMKDYLRYGMDKAHSLGISACGSYDSGGRDFDRTLEVYRAVYDECRAQGRPGLRVTMQCGISIQEELLQAHLDRGIYRAPLWEDPRWGNFLKMGSIKLFADGTLGGQTAWMRQPYKDKPETQGLSLMSQESLDNFVQMASGGGMQVLTHAIGDAGIDAVLQSYEKVTSPGHNPLRHGIIHCQITSPDLLERLAKNRILTLVQPIFLADDMAVLESRVGKDLASTSYAWNSMHKLGIPVSYSTDAPVSALDPLLCLQWAVDRQDSHERVDVHTAFEAYTAAAAYANFDEEHLGRIAPGFLADLCILDKDIFSIPPGEIHSARVIRTICGGETVYQL
ncbi:MAG: amidohydrolase [Treponema sp.]|nr:amidohydrolase [Treponema sp.]